MSYLVTAMVALFGLFVSAVSSFLPVAIAALKGAPSRAVVMVLCLLSFGLAFIGRAYSFTLSMGWFYGWVQQMGRSGQFVALVSGIFNAVGVAGGLLWLGAVFLALRAPAKLN